MRIDLPEYVINSNLITAVRRNNACYVKGVLRSCPWLRDALFYSEANNVNISLFEHSYRPPVFLLLTLFAYAVRYNSKKVMSTLRALEVDMYKPCYLADMLEESTVLEPCYRLLELSPIALCRPTDPGIVSAVDCGYDLHNLIIVRTFIYRGTKAIEEAVFDYRGYWEFCLGSSKRNQNSQSVNELTKTIVSGGYDVNVLLKQVDLCKLFSRYYQLTMGRGFRNADFAIHAIEFIEILVQHGCCLSERQLVHNVYKALGEIIQSSNHTRQSHDRLLQLIRSVVLLSADINYVKRLEMSLVNHVIRTMNVNTLLTRCVRYLRLLLGGRFFQRNVAKLKCSEEVKRLIIAGNKENN